MEGKVLSIITKVLEVENSEVELDTMIGDIPEWDSLHHLLLVKALEDEFSIKFSSEELMELEDVSDIVKLVEEKKLK